MSHETYTPGDSENVTAFMERRSLETHGMFFRSYLKPGLRVIDCGCGPGVITLGLAAVVADGSVLGVELNESQVAVARQTATVRGVENVEFTAGSAYELPCPDESVDRVFSHALMEHLAEPERALREFYRVLKPGGIVGVCSPDWDGFIVAPTGSGTVAAMTVYADLQARNGGDLRIGKRLGSLLGEVGFSSVEMTARYECYPDRQVIGEYLALQLVEADEMKHAQALRNCTRADGGLFAQCWISAVGTKAID